MSIEQKILFDYIKIPRRILSNISSNFKNGFGKCLFSYVMLLSLSTYSASAKKPYVHIDSFSELQNILKLNLKDFEETLKLLTKLKLISIENSTIYITGFEVTEANKNFRHPNIIKGIKTSFGFIFVPKCDIKTLESLNAKYYSCDIITSLFLKFVYRDPALPNSLNNSAICYFNDIGYLTSYGKLSEKYDKSKSIIYEIITKAEKNNILSVTKNARYSILSCNNYEQLFSPYNKEK